MFDSYSDGFCPQCLLANKQVAMGLNRMDFWECPNCRLQMSGNGVAVMVLRLRGQGIFKQCKVAATDHLVGVLLQKQSTTDPLASGGNFRDEKDFRTFLEKEVK